MNEFLQDNKRILYIFFALFLIVALVVYFLLVHPLRDDVDRKESSIASKEREIELLEEQIVKLEKESAETNVEELLLIKNIPEKRMLDDYILDLEKLQFKTNSEIYKVSFTYDSAINNHEVEDEDEEEDSNASENEENNEEDKQDTNNNNEEQTETSNDEEGKKEDEVDDELEPIKELPFVAEKPEELEVLALTVTALVESYDDLIDLVKTIENMERISIVTNFTFSNASEEKEFFEENYKGYIPFEMTVLTFYYPEVEND